ncbi:MAG: MBL fold metallo-hydrolase, partial [Verrucomicrobia bacterium]|nr:MBL fold metallo-hydrolase [Verrucomicrobiota bacterium]
MKQHKRNGHFFNPLIKHSKRDLWNVLLWLLGYYKDTQGFQEPSVDFSFPKKEREGHADGPMCKWIGHSTFLVQAGNVTLVTDPVWSKRVSPLPMVGPKRLIDPPITLSELPQIDLVLISHDHYDHLDEPTIKALVRKFPNILFCVPLGLKKWFLRRKIKNLIELDWWQSKNITLAPGKELQVTSVPAQHFSGRGLFDRNKTLWCGWMVDFLSAGSLFRRCYFAGDTGYNPVDFREIGERFSPIHLSLLPIGSYSPASFMAPVHIG